MNVELQIQAAQKRINKMIDDSAREALVIIEANAMMAKKRITEKINHVHFQKLIRDKFPNAEFICVNSEVKMAVL